jgi:hypothetical protein
MQPQDASEFNDFVAKKYFVDILNLFAITQREVRDED